MHLSDIHIRSIPFLEELPRLPNPLVELVPITDIGHMPNDGDVSLPHNSIAEQLFPLSRVDAEKPDMEDFTLFVLQNEVGVVVQSIEADAGREVGRVGAHDFLTDLEVGEERQPYSTLRLSTWTSRSCLLAIETVFWSVIGVPGRAMASFSPSCAISTVARWNSKGRCSAASVGEVKVVEDWRRG